MRAFAVFDGGGVKGAALAGCLAAANDQGIEFVGYGGTSAGAIIATLGAAGYTGREVLELLKGEFSPVSFLDDDGTRLRAARSCSERASALLQSNKWKLVKLFEASKLYDEIHALMSSQGLYSGTKFKTSLLRLLKKKLNLPDNQGDVTFDDFVRCQRPSLKIVASDISARRVARFSYHDTNYGRSVVDAVRASAGYPLLFEPLKMASGVLLSDGGLASNLPTFLFAQDHLVTQYPILAFDLVADPEVHSGAMQQLCGDLLATALEAGDAIIHTMGPGVVPISVPVPPGISTLDLELTSEQTEQLFYAGLNAASKFLGEWPRLKLSRDAGAAIQRQLLDHLRRSEAFRTASLRPCSDDRDANKSKGRTITSDAEHRAPYELANCDVQLWLP